MHVGEGGGSGGGGSLREQLWGHTPLSHTPWCQCPGRTANWARVGSGQCELSAGWYGGIRPCGGGSGDVRCESQKLEAMSLFRWICASRRRRAWFPGGR